MKIKKYCKGFLLGILFLITCQFSALAHDPPYQGRTECGLIDGSTFYSDYYSPPSGTPAVNGTCSWVKQGTSSCGTRTYGGLNYTVYTYKWVCNLPLDNNVCIMMVAFGALGFFKLRKTPILSKKIEI